MQLASLALPSHPLTLAFIPGAFAMENEEPFSVVGSGTIALVQARDAIHGHSQKFVVTGESFTGRVHPIREQRKTQVTVRIRQKVDLQPLHLLLDFLRLHQKRGHHDNGSCLFRHATLKFESRQGSRAEQFRYHSIDQRNGQVRRGHCSK